MPLVEINWRPDRKTLRDFSEVGMFALGMVLAPLSWWRDRPAAAVACWALAVLLRLVGLARPGWLRPAFVGLSLATWPIGWVVSHAALALTYYLVLTPIGLAMRLAGRDPLRRRLDPAAPTYWEPYSPDRGLRRYLRQY